MRVFVSKAGVAVSISDEGILTVYHNRHGKFRKWTDMVRTPGSKPDWDAKSEAQVLLKAGWEEV